VRRIAVLRANGVGDFLVAVPALDALRAAYPDAELTYLGVPWHLELLPGRPGPWDRVLAVPPYPHVGAPGDTDPDSEQVQRFFAEQQEAGYDVAVQLHGGGGNSNPFVSRLGARVTIGSRDVGAPPVDRWTPYVYYQHETLRFLEVVGLVGAAPVTLEPRLAVTPADGAEADAVLPPDAGPLVVLHPGATDPRRRWPAESFAVVGDELAARGGSVVVVGTAEDAAAAREIASAMHHPVTDLTGRLSLRGTTGLLARATLVVGNDSGPRHLAAAVGTATVGIYWCGNLINAGPLTRTRHRVAVSFRTLCPVCGMDQGRGRCEHDVSFVADVQPDDVLRPALDLYAAETVSAAA
jgi:ADP-heptose:LPS heptosyltransferase